MADLVNHPANCGGAENPYDTIKVLRAWMTPQEFAGFLKGNAILHVAGDTTVDELQKSIFYCNALADFIEEEGQDVIYPPRLFWTEAEPEPTEDTRDLLGCAESYVPIALHSNVEPHVQWFVRVSLVDNEGEPDGDEILDFPDRAAAQAYCDSAAESEPAQVEQVPACAS